MQNAAAQFQSVTVGVNGLTCSACSRTVEMSIRKLPFVKDVEMNLENTVGKIYFNENAEVDINKIAKAVTDAGFSVRFLTGIFRFNGSSVRNGKCIEDGEYGFQFINDASKELTGDVEMKFIGQNFLPKKEYGKLKSGINNSSCVAKSKKHYYVSL